MKKNYQLERKESSCYGKIIVFFTLAIISMPLVHAQSSVSDTAADAGNSETAAPSAASAAPAPVASKAGVSEVPPAKRPVKPGKDKIADSEASDPGSTDKNRETLRFGLESDICDLLDKITSSGDVRLTEDVYDLFEVTRSANIREKILLYFTKLEDPCLEDYAVTILNDPYDERKSTVDAVFRYIQAVKTKAAVPAVLMLLENDNQDYWEGAITTLGEIGGSEEALYLTAYLERDELTTPQKQSLVKVLGKLKAVETYDKLSELAQDKDENTFIRMYSAEAIGAMEKEEAVPILAKLYEDNDPNMRTYVIKGISHFSDKEAKEVLIQAIRDTYYKVRLEAIDAVKQQKMTEAVPYLIYRAKTDKENVVKNACYPVIASLNTKEGNEYLVGMITDKNTADSPKSRAAAALLEQNNAGTKEILSLAEETLKDDRRKPLRYALGKEFAKYTRPEFAGICKKYIASSDPSTQGTGLDIYARGRYADVTPDVKALADYYKTTPEEAAKNASSGTAAAGTKKTPAPLPKKKNANADKAARILGIKIEDDSAPAEPVSSPAAAQAK